MSSARSDAEAVEHLVEDLRLANHHLWSDDGIVGGVDWWEAVLEAIEDTDVLIFALSPSSASSRACLSELEYAVALNKHVLPVLVRDTDIELAPDALREHNVLNYRVRNTETSVQLVSAVNRLLGDRRSPPDPLPPPPSSPVTDVTLVESWDEQIVRAHQVSGVSEAIIRDWIESHLIGEQRVRVQTTVRPVGTTNNL